MSEETERSAETAEGVALVRKRMEKRIQHIQQISPSGVEAIRLIEIATMAITRNPDLLNCTLPSILVSVIQAAELGLTLSPVTGHAYLVPFYDHGTKLCQLIPGYRGLIKLACNTGIVGSIDAQIVREGDEYDAVHGTSRHLVHRKKDFTGKITRVYMVAHFTNGVPAQFEEMTFEQTEEIRKASKAKKGPWQTEAHIPEMRRKCPVRKGFKYLPIDAEPVYRAIALSDRETADDPTAPVDDTPARVAAFVGYMESDREPTGGVQGADFEVLLGKPATARTDALAAEVGAPAAADEKVEEDPETERLRKKFFAMTTKEGWNDSDRHVLLKRTCRNEEGALTSFRQCGAAEFKELIKAFEEIPAE